MKTEIEKFKKRIELIYEDPEQQIKKTRSIIGNYYFTKEQISEMRRFKAERIKIYNELKRLPSELFCKIAYKIEQGFLDIWDDQDSIREPQKLFKEARSNIQQQVNKLDGFVEKTNEELQNKNSYFTNFPITINVQISSHHLDKAHPAKPGRPKKAKNILIKELSDLLKSQLPEDADRSEFISEILRFFYGVPKLEAYPRTVRKAF
jgi:hypothetical protein